MYGVVAIVMAVDALSMPIKDRCDDWTASKWLWSKFAYCCLLCLTHNGNQPKVLAAEEEEGEAKCCSCSQTSSHWCDFDVMLNCSLSPGCTLTVSVCVCVCLFVDSFRLLTVAVMLIKGKGTFHRRQKAILWLLCSVSNWLTLPIPPPAIT